MKRLLNRKQGKNLVFKHALEFRTIAAWTEWDETALRGTFLHSLSDKIKNQLASRDDPQSLDELILLAMRIDNRFYKRIREQNYNSQLSGFHPTLPPTSSLHR